MFKVIFTASSFNQDTEEEFSGWLDPKWSMTQLHENDTDVRTFTFDTYAEAVEFIEETIGDAEDFQNGEDYYAADSHTDMVTGEVWSYTAHLSEEK